MKKRDFTKLALLGIAMGLCGGPVEADDLCPTTICENSFAATCGQQKCGASSTPSQAAPQTTPEANHNHPPHHQPTPSPTTPSPQPQQGNTQSFRVVNKNGQIAQAEDPNQEEPCGASNPSPGAPNNLPRQNMPQK